MAGIHRTRPGAADMAGATGVTAVACGDGVWMSPGWSNSYMLATDEGRVIINTGMGFEGPLHRGALDRDRHLARESGATDPRSLRSRWRDRRRQRCRQRGGCSGELRHVARRQ